MAAPVSTISNAAGSKLSSQSLAANASATFDLDYSAKIGGFPQVGVTFGPSVSATAGVQIDVFRRIGAGPTVDTIAALPAVIPATASTTQYRSIALGTGRYRVKLTNLDTSNAVTVVANDETVDSIS